jgi:glutamate-1-semialdehyde 2,1-aminomutase
VRADTLESSVEEEYIQANPRSAAMHKRQSVCVPSGVTHSTRSFSPFPLFVRQCVGARKWDVDDHEYVDYWLGHGSLLLGHAHPSVVAAVREQLERGFHAGGETELGCRWAELVCKLVPSAEQVRFTACGGEATQLALRIARTFTGKNKILKFQHHFHGWHDAVAVGMWPPWDLPYSPGIPPRVMEETLVVPCNDIAAVRAVLDNDMDIAGVILEPGGGFSDTVPIDPLFLSELRQVTRDRGVVLIFDEVVTGFRYSTGGAQQFFDVLPDLTTLGKVVGGGLPSGAVAGRAELMSLFAVENDSAEGRRRLIPHHGTWNANPVAAAAGVATLGLVSSQEPVEFARRRADDLREGLSELFGRLSLPAVAYGRSSIWRTSLGEGYRCLDGDFSNYVEEAEQLSRGWGTADAPLRRAMLLNGVDLMRANGFTSSAHSEDDIEHTIHAFERSIKRLRREGTLEV